MSNEILDQPSPYLEKSPALQELEGLRQAWNKKPSAVRKGYTLRLRIETDEKTSVKLEFVAYFKQQFDPWFIMVVRHWLVASSPPCDTFVFETQLENVAKNMLNSWNEKKEQITQLIDNNMAEVSGIDE